MAEQEIGAARVHLVVDATDYDAAIARATNAARGFGNDAEQAFDKSSGGVRRAARQLLDYVSNLGKTSDQLRLLRAAQQGVDHSIIDAAAAAMVDYRQQTEAAAAAARDLARAQDEANRINSAFNDQRTTNAQRDINSVLGVGAADAEQQARRRADAEAALLPILQQEEAAYEAIYAEAIRINQARDEHNRLLAQQNFNTDLGVDQPRSGTYLAEQQRVVAALTAEFQQMDAAIDAAFAQNTEIERFRQQLENLKNTAGKTHYELLQMRADQLGVGESFRPIIKSIQDQDAAMGHAGITAKQYEWAMRGLPAQITDIAVSLVSGQPAYLVALQQGGQIKDMFGGIAPAARALGSSLLGLVNPWTIAGVAIAGAAYAAYDAAKSMEELAIAVAKGDQVAGTAEQMYALADALDKVDGVDLSSAESAVARLASGGKLTGENFNLAAEAMARWAAASGEKVDDVAAKFEAIAKGPLEAIESGQIRVTQAQYEHIKSLVETGQQQQEAVNELTKIFYDTVNSNSDMVEAHINALSQGWRDVKDEIGEAFRGIGDFVTAGIDGIRSVTAELNKLTNGGFSKFIYEVYTRTNLIGAAARFSRERSSASATEPPNIEAGATYYDPEQAKRDKERNDALAQWTATADKAAQRELQLNKIREQGTKLGQNQAAIEAVVARQRKQWAEQDSKAAARAAGQGSEGTQAIRDQAAAEIAAITTQTRLLQSQYDQRQITVEDYYDKLRQYADDELAVTLRSIEAQKVAVAGRKDASTRIEQLEAQAARAREQNAARGIELSEGERKAVQQREIAYRDYVRALDEANQAAQRNADLEVARVGMGQVQYERMVAVNELLRHRTELEAELNRRVADGNLEPGDAERYREALEKVNEQISIMVDGWQRVDEAQSSFLLGAQGAWQDWLKGTRDVAAQGRDLMTSVWEGFSSATADALNGNLKSFDSFFENIHVQILNFIVKQQLTKWLSSLGSVLSGTQGNGFWGTLSRGAGSLLGGSSGSDAGSISDLFSGSWGFAQGGVPGGAGIAAYRNSIVSQPTIFPFARGGVPNVGLMGERSGASEAIMPLVRDSGGNLSVRATQASQRGPTYLNQQFVVQGTPDRTTREQMAKKAGRETSRAMART